MLIIFSELKPRKGIPYCRDHLRRLWKAGKFPRPVDIGPGRLAWVEEEVDAYIEKVIANRDQRLPAQPSATDRAKGPETIPGASRENTPRTVERPPREQYRTRPSS